MPDATAVSRDDYRPATDYSAHNLAIGTPIRFRPVRDDDGQEELELVAEAEAIHGFVAFVKPEGFVVSVRRPPERELEQHIVRWGRRTIMGGMYWIEVLEDS